jgi:pilus assembly protein CpaF
MIGMAGLDISPTSIRRQIASAINVIVQIERMDDGVRRVVSVTEIAGMEEEMIVSQEIFRFRRQGHTPDGMVEGVFEATGVRPKFLDHSLVRGFEFAPATFAQGRRSI